MKRDINISRKKERKNKHKRPYFFITVLHIPTIDLCSNFEFLFAGAERGGRNREMK